MLELGEKLDPKHPWRGAEGRWTFLVGKFLESDDLPESSSAKRLEPAINRVIQFVLETQA
jgi:hypothetical protein